MKKPETVADVIEIVTKINAAIEEYYKVIKNYPITISDTSLRTLKNAAEMYIEKIGEIKIK